ncbi:MAG: hypothetical protein R6V11_03465 [Ectothiorhodospiraceae bacterium]
MDPATVEAMLSDFWRRLARGVTHVLQVA